MISTSEIVLRLFLSFLFGAFIGLERERKHWVAGLRTHMMVCVGACLTMIVSSFGFKDILGTPNVNLDPSRVAAQVISGIGFIGAGTILFLRQGTVRGLTTASGLWTVAAIGLATGGGLYFAAICTTILAIIILWAIQPFERLYFGKQKTLKLIIGNNDDISEIVKKLSTIKDTSIQGINIDKSLDDSVINIRFEKSKKNTLQISELLEQLKDTKSIKEFIWE